MQTFRQVSNNVDMDGAIWQFINISFNNSKLGPSSRAKRKGEQMQKQAILFLKLTLPTTAS